MESAEDDGRRSGRDTETKTRTPHKNVGNEHNLCMSSYLDGPWD